MSEYYKITKKTFTQNILSFYGLTSSYQDNYGSLVSISDKSNFVLGPDYSKENAIVWKGHQDCVRYIDKIRYNLRTNYTIYPIKLTPRKMINYIIKILGDEAKDILNGSVTNKIIAMEPDGNEHNGVKFCKFYIVDIKEEKDEIINKDIIYKNIEDNTTKIKIKENRTGGFAIYPINMDIPIITFEQPDENKEEYMFLVDIKDKDEFKYKTIIKTKNDLEKAINFVLEVFNEHPIFYKYVDDIEKLKI